MSSSREKSSQNGRIHFGVLRDEKNRRFVSYAVLVKGAK